MAITPKLQTRAVASNEIEIKAVVIESESLAMKWIYYISYSAETHK